MATLGKGHFCGGIDGYAGRRSFLWRDWWLCWEKGFLRTYWWLRWDKDIFVAVVVAILREGYFCGGISGYVEKGAAKLRDGCGQVGKWDIFSKNQK